MYKTNDSLAAAMRADACVSPLHTMIDDVFEAIVVACIMGKSQPVRMNTFPDENAMAFKSRTAATESAQSR